MSLVISNLTLSTPKRCLIKDLSLTVKPNERWVVLGPNGAGKSSLLKSCVGLGTQSGIAIKDKAISDYTPKERANHIGLLSQQSLTGFNTRTIDLVLSGSFSRSTAYWNDQEHIDQAKALLYSLGLSNQVTQIASALSGGELRRAEIARLMLQNPYIMLLDEPLNHLDLHQQKATQDILLDHLRMNNKAALWVEHDLNRAKAIATHALLLKGDGTWKAGTASEYLTIEHLSELLDTPLQSIGEQGYLSVSY